MRKIVQSINSIAEHHCFPWIMVLVALLYVTFFSVSTSPLYVNEGMDSAIFKSMGLAMTQGKVPYVDLFDHKGPVLYFINALGQWIWQGRLGIFLLQIIAASISFIYLYKTTRLFLNGIQSVAIMVVSLFLFSGFYQSGNLCEEWILAFISPCLFLLLSDIVHGELKHVSPLYGFIYGICFGLAFFIRPNDALAILGGALLGTICYAWFVKKENIIRICCDILAFLCGFVVVCIPIYVYFAYHHAINDFIYGLFVHNSLYSDGIKGILLSYKKVAYILVWFVLWSMIWKTPYRRILFVVIPICIFQFLVMGSRVFPHYLIDYIILFILLGVFLIQLKDTHALLWYCALLYCVTFIGRINVFRNAEDAILERITMIYSHDEQSRAFYAESENLLNMVPINMQDSIWNYNVTWRENFPPYSSIFFHHGITQCNKVPHYTMCYVSEKLKREDDIKLFNPPYIVLTHCHDDDTIRQPIWAYFDEDYQYIYANYDLIAETDRAVCDIELFRRKN